MKEVFPQTKTSSFPPTIASSSILLKRPNKCAILSTPSHTHIHTRCPLHKVGSKSLQEQQKSISTYSKLAKLVSVVWLRSADMPGGVAGGCRLLRRPERKFQWRLWPNLGVDLPLFGLDWSSATSGRCSNDRDRRRLAASSLKKRKACLQLLGESDDFNIIYINCFFDMR